MRALTVLAALALGSVAVQANAAPTVYGITFAGTGIYIEPQARNYIYNYRDFAGTFTFDPVTNQLISIDAFFRGREILPGTTALLNTVQPCNLDCFVAALEGGSFAFDPFTYQTSITYGDPLNGTVSLNAAGITSLRATIVGNIQFNGAIPEPGTWLMMLFGFGALGWSLRRARKAAASFAV